MKRILFFLLCCISVATRAQQISYAEYFYDTDPGVGNGAAITITAPADSINITTALSTAALQPGFHTLQIRVRYSNGVWGLFEGRSFYVQQDVAQTATSRQIKAAEYFFDTDPGVGNGTAIATGALADSVSLTAALNTSALQPGFHTLQIRVKDSINVWSLFESRSFYVQHASTNTTAPKLIAAEYFFNTDPGVGNGTPISPAFALSDSIDLLRNLPTTGLALGKDTLVVRVKDSSGTWSLSASRAFTLCASMLATPAVSGSTAACSTGTIALSASTVAGAAGYKWTGPNSFTANTQSISIANATAANAGAYTVVAWRSGSTACDTSNPASVTVTVGGACAPFVNGTLPASACQGSTLSIPVSSNYGTYTSGNVFTAQLSSASGSFASPVTIGTMTSTTGGTITATIATAQAAGTGYRIRIVSSNPAQTGPDNGVNIAVLSQPITTQVTISPTATQTICAGASVTLSVPVTTGATYQWRLGGADLTGATANTYAATAAGTYTVLVTNAAGCSRLSAGRIVNVQAAPVATIAPSAAQAICAGGSVAFSVNATTGATYQWKKDGAAVSGATTTAYTATTAGSYSVTVTSSAGCANTSSAVGVTVNEVPTAAINPAAAQSVCTGGGMPFSVNTTSGASYQWRKDGTAITGATAATYSATTAGSYSVTVTSSAGCAATSAAVALTVNATPTATISPATAQTICSGSSVAFSVNTTTGAAYQWMKDGANIAGATAATYTATTTGSYSVMVTSSTGCAATSASVAVTVNLCATATITGFSPATTLCQGGPVAVNFSVSMPFNAGNIFTAQLSNASGSFASPVTIGTLSATDAGTINASIPAAQAAGSGYRIRIVASNPAFTSTDNGSNIAVAAPPTIAQATISPTSATAICQGSSATIAVSAVAGFSWQWSLDGTPIAGATANILSATQAGGYTVVVSNAAGCSRTSAVKTVTVNPIPDATIDPVATQNICGVSAITFSAPTGTGYTYIWYKNNAVISGATAATYAATAIGAYKVKVTGAGGCNATSAAVSVISACAPVATTAGTLVRCGGSTVSIAYTASGFVSGNVMSLELSDAAGSFGTPFVIGSVTSTGNGTITGTIPDSTQPGTGYKVRVTSSNPATTGSTAPATIVVRGPIEEEVSLCAVTVDSATGRNKLIWSKPASLNIDSFVFYRQNNMALYQRIGAQAYSAFSTWIDATGTPAQRSHAYYIAAKNLCSETAPLDTHRTMHLAISKGTDNATWNLIWNRYEGAAHTYYNIYRGTTAANLSLLTTIPAYDYNSYTDNSAPAGGAVYYMVTVADGPACAPSKGTAGGLEIASNIATNAVPGSPATAGGAEVQVFPNPSQTLGTLVIRSPDPDAVYSVRVTDVTGRVVVRLRARTDQAQTIGDGLMPGLYTVEAWSSDGRQRVFAKWTKL